MNEAVWSTSFEDSIEALSDPQRREVLTSLLEGERAPDSTPVVSPRESTGGSLRVAGVEEAHLRTLAEHGFVEYDPETHGVECGPNFREIRPLLELFDDYEIEPPDGWL